MTKLTDLHERITNYLENGGLLNPEMMEHDKVRQLLIDCRTEIAALAEHDAKLVSAGVGWHGPAFCVPKSDADECEREAEHKGWCGALRRVLASLIGYPNAGGDTEIMQQVERICVMRERKARFEEAAKVMVEERKWVCEVLQLQYAIPANLCNQVGQRYADAVELRAAAGGGEEPR